jgi:hypothetical protein
MKNAARFGQIFSQNTQRIEYIFSENRKSMSHIVFKLGED